MKKSVLVFLHFVFCVFLLLSPLQLIGNNQDDRPLPSLAELIGEPPLIELAEENLPLYVTYLRLNQKEPIRDCELMGGFGIITSYADSSYCCKFETLFLIGEGLSKPSDLFYISQEEGPILTSKIQWKPIQQYGIDRAVTEFELPSDEELSSNQLLISLDGKNWYSYLVVNNDLTAFFVRQSALPMEVNNDGYPIRKWEKFRNNMRREIPNQPRQ